MNSRLEIIWFILQDLWELLGMVLILASICAAAYFALKANWDMAELMMIAVIMMDVRSLHRRTDKI